MNESNSPQTSAPAQTGSSEPGMVSLLSRPGVTCALLALMVVAVFWPVKDFDFLNYGDSQYITANAHVRQGLTLQSLAWAVTATDHANWHPLTWFSHMLDVDLFGLKPAGAHLLNLLFHVANTLLVFLLLRQLTGAHWRSAFVAALFALHPLHVESVAWISQRKDLLSALFFLLSLMAYARYAGRQAGFEQQNTTAATDSRSMLVDYLLALLFFVLGLMAKPMVVTLPFVLLLLDYWPLKRFSGFELRRSAPARSSDRQADTQSPKLETLVRLVAEKLPFFACSAVICAVTWVARGNAGDLEGFLTAEVRVSGALMAYVGYLAKAFWPADLALAYPVPGPWPVLWVAGSALLVAALCAAALWLGRRFPFALTGWFWFLGTLIPVIGLVPMGPSAPADRYTYVPLIGLFIVVVWGAAAAGQRLRLPKAVLAAAGVLVLCAATIRARDQLGFWRNSETVFRHTIAVTTNNARAYDFLGAHLYRHGNPEQAAEAFETALRINPSDYLAYSSLGSYHYNANRLDEALANYRQALRLNPADPITLNNLGSLLLRQGSHAEAIECLKTALQLKPDYPEAHNNLGVALNEVGQPSQAMQHFRAALQLAPEDADAHSNYGNALVAQGNLQGAIEQYRQALRINPQYIEALNNLGWVLAGAGHFDEAVDCYTQALNLKPEDAGLHRNFAHVLSGAKRAQEALAQYQEAARLVPNDPETCLGIGQTLAQLGRREEAIEQIKKALQLRPGYPAAERALQSIGAE